jgi:hypothetical protein
MIQSFKIVMIGMMATFLFGACVPKIYVIDKQTVLEEEAAGEWPQFEKQFLNQAKAMGPTPFYQVAPSPAREKIYNVLNDELTSRQTDAKKQ